jgi:hypothetical protein
MVLPRSSVGRGIEPGVVADFARVAAEQRLAPAPTPAADDFTGVCFYDELSPVANQLRIDTKRAEQRRFDLRCAVRRRC